MNLTTSLLFSDNRQIESAYIIAVKGNNESEKLAFRSLESCRAVDQDAKLWRAFDGTNRTDIIVPPHLEHQEYIRWIKQPNDKYSTSQIAVFFSHLSLWSHCASIDRPIIILEHDAILIKKLHQHNYYNCIQYLGNKEYYENNKVPIGLPPHGSIYNGHWRFICRAHAYAIDPPIARNLLSYAIREGMTKTLDVFIRCDIFAIVQDGMYAYDERGMSTIEDKENYTEDC
jgi:hypothetical protein